MDQDIRTKIELFKGALEALKLCTIPSHDHDDPVSVIDCWKTVEDHILLMPGKFTKNCPFLFAGDEVLFIDSYGAGPYYGTFDGNQMVNNEYGGGQHVLIEGEAEILMVFPVGYGRKQIAIS